jgi:hypothetical protein
MIYSFKKKQFESSENSVQVFWFSALRSSLRVANPSRGLEFGSLRYHKYAIRKDIEN